MPLQAVLTRQVVHNTGQLLNLAYTNLVPSITPWTKLETLIKPLCVTRTVLPQVCHIFICQFHYQRLIHVLSFCRSVFAWLSVISAEVWFSHLKFVDGWELILILLYLKCIILYTYSTCQQLGHNYSVIVTCRWVQTFDWSCIWFLLIDGSSENHSVPSACPSCCPCECHYASKNGPKKTQQHEDSYIISSQIKGDEEPRRVPPDVPLPARPLPKEPWQMFIMNGEASYTLQC